MPLIKNNEKLLIYHEGRKRRVRVAKLIHHKDRDHFELIYDQDYVISKTAIPLGVELSLFKEHHFSEKGKLFPSLMDRIPSRENPAYEDYCRSQGIAVNEDNLIILLGTIGRRGPSSFVFEAIYEDEEPDGAVVASFRKSLGLSQHDFSLAFDFSTLTIHRVESSVSRDHGTLSRVKIYMEFPEVALWQLKRRGGRIHSSQLMRAVERLKEKLKTVIRDE